MAFSHGKLAAILLGSADISAYFTDMGFSADCDTADTSTFGSSWKTAIVGMTGSKVDCKGLYDPAFVTLPTLLADAGDVLTIGPAGLVTIGNRARLASVESTAYAESSPVGGVGGVVSTGGK